MPTRRRPFHLGSIVLVCLGVMALAAPANASGPRSNAERAFLIDMVGHHTMAVTMAEMAEEKATHQELKTLASEIITAQRAEIRRMRAWLRSWYDRRLGDDDLDMGHEDMHALEGATGAAFEVRFLAMMSVHHTQAVERARAVRRSRLHGQVRKLTGDIVRDQQREIGQMQEWLVAWYAN